jgi:cytidylate kinase
LSPYPAITISRSLGCGGAEVGFLVARRLGWRFCDRRILRLAAEAAGSSVAGLARREERPSGFLDQMLNVLGFGCPEAPCAPLLEPPMYSRDLYQLQREVMLGLVARAPSVIVGRGGFFALKELPQALHVSFDADPAYRCRSLVQRGKMPDLETARKEVAASDRERAAFIRDISGLDWHDPLPFQLVLDVSLTGIDGCVELILDEAERRFLLVPGQRQRPGVEDPQE